MSSNSGNDGRSSRSGTEPPRNHRFGQPDANPSGDQHAAALAKAAKNRTIEVLSEALNADETGFERILGARSTPYVARKLLESFHGDGPMSSQGVRALLALWQTVFPEAGADAEPAEPVINERIHFDPGTDTVLIRLPRYPDDGRRMPGYMIDPRDGSSRMMAEDPDGRGGYIAYINGAPKRHGIKPVRG
jgi:hypothetical protein